MPKNQVLFYRGLWPILLSFFVLTLLLSCQSSDQPLKKLTQSYQNYPSSGLPKNWAMRSNVYSFGQDPTNYLYLLYSKNHYYIMVDFGQYQQVPHLEFTYAKHLLPSKLLSTSVNQDGLTHYARYQVNISEQNLLDAVDSHLSLWINNQGDIIHVEVPGSFINLFMESVDNYNDKY